MAWTNIFPENTNRYKANTKKYHITILAHFKIPQISQNISNQMFANISQMSPIWPFAKYIFFFQDIWSISIISKSTSCKTYIKRLQIDCLRIAREWSWVSREAKKWLKAPKEAVLHSTSPSWLIIGDHKYTIKKDTFKRKAGSF